MTDYILITSVTAEKLFGVFEESVRETCAKDYSAVQLDAWIARATPARWQQLLSGDLHFIAAVNQTSGELAGFASINPDGYLHSMFVRPGYQKKGVASFMLHALEDWVMRFQASDIYSEVSITALPFFLFLYIDSRYFRTGTYIDVETLAKRLGSLYEQSLTV